ncbi:MAG: nuclear transport factor 2 family protein [Flavobacteriales bacterium]
MMRPLALALLFVACAPRFEPSDEVAIRKVMSEQEMAWDRGDIPGFMAGYADTTCFIGKKGKTCGREAVTANYLKSYPDKAAMGDLAFGIHEVVPAGAEHAWMTGTWNLYRAADTLGGGFSLLWVKGAEGWRIARDHTY